jgi:hypothetical protein
VPIGLVILSGVLALGVLGLGFYVLLTTRYRDAEPAWRTVATSLGGEVIRTATSLGLLAVVDGRPIKVATIQRGRGRKARTFTVVGAALRHPDDILTGTAPPSSSAEAWSDAWMRASKELADRRLPSSPTGTRHVEGILANPEELRAAIDDHLATIRAREERVLAWVSAGAELGLTSRAAYLLVGTWNEREVVIGGDVLSKTVTVRAKSTTARHDDDLVIAKRDATGIHHLDRLADVELPNELVLYAADPVRTHARCKSVLRLVGELGDDAVIRADEHGATVELKELVPEIECWRRALDIASKLA